jgi:hypothetical protein
MLPKTHMTWGFLISLVLFLIFPEITLLGAIIIFLASFLIDFDHYLYYLYKQKNFSLKNAYVWFIEKSIHFKKLTKSEQEKYKRAIMIFHGIEFWVILTLLILFIHKLFLYVLIGIVIHMILDYLDLYKNDQPLYIKTSQIYTHIKNRKKAEF